MPSAYLQWRFHSGERVVARGPLVFFFATKIFHYRFLSLYERQSLQLLYTPTACWSILCKRKQWCWNLFCLLFFLFSISHSMSKIFKELLHLGFWNLVQTLGSTTCIVQDRISILMFIIPFIYPFVFFSDDIFLSDFSGTAQRFWNMLQTFDMANNSLYLSIFLWFS